MLRVIILSVLVACATATTWGDVCQKDSVCTDTDSKCIINGGCDWGQCGCAEDWTSNAAYTACVEVTWKKVGESCAANADQCMGDKTYCHSTTDICTCHTGYTGSSGDKDCTFRDNLSNNGGSCTYPQDCEAYKYYAERKNKGKSPENHDSTVQCYLSLCVCNTYYITNSDLNKCESNLKGHDEACSTHLDCDSNTYPGLQCVSSKCGCAAGHEKMSGWDVYDEYKDTCMPTGSETNIKKGEICSVPSGSTIQKSCAKGLECYSCPNDNVNRYCQDGAAAFGISFVLLLGALMLQL